MLQVFGIKNCNTVKKAIDWLNANKLAYTFNDYKKTPITKEKLIEWNAKLSWDKLINKKGTTWRKVPLEDQEKIVDFNSAAELIMKNNSLLKRPVIEVNNELIIGFNEQEYQTKLIDKQ